MLSFLPTCVFDPVFLKFIIHSDEAHSYCKFLQYVYIQYNLRQFPSTFWDNLITHTVNPIPAQSPTKQKKVNNFGDLPLKNHTTFVYKTVKRG